MTEKSVIKRTKALGDLTFVRGFIRWHGEDSHLLTGYGMISSGFRFETRIRDQRPPWHAKIMTVPI